MRYGGTEVSQHLLFARIVESLEVSWHTANDAVLAEAQQFLIDDPARFDGLTTVGVNEHLWCHTRLGDRYVTVVIDLTPAREKTGPARLLDTVPGRSKHAFKTWLASDPKAWRDRAEVVAMDGFTGYKSAASKQIPDATVVIDPGSMSSPCSATHSTRPTNTSNRKLSGTAAERATHSRTVATCCAQARDRAAAQRRDPSVAACCARGPGC